MDPTTPTVYVLIGPPASGKSTFAKNTFNPIDVVSSDTCRGIISGDENDQTVSRGAWRIMHAIVRAKLDAQRPTTVVDATSVKIKDRRALIQSIRSWMTNDTKIIGLVFAPTVEEMIRRNKERERQVPDNVIKSMTHALKSVPPSVSEGFDELRIVDNAMGLPIDFPTWEG